MQDFIVKNVAMLFTIIVNCFEEKVIVSAIEKYKKKSGRLSIRPRKT